MSKDTVVTAGHCVYNNGWGKNYIVTPGKNGASNPYGSVRGVECQYTDKTWISGRNKNQDWGILKLDSTIGNRVGWLGLRWQSASYNNTPITVRGYPGEKSNQMWTMSGKVATTRPNALCYTVDTTGGQSGAPVYKSDNVGIAIHAYGVGAHCRNQNGATRITKSLYKIIDDVRRRP